MVSVAEIIGESFERALNTGKREDSFSNALIVISAGINVPPMFKAISKSEDKEETIGYLTSYFKGEIKGYILEKKLGVKRW